MHEGRILKSGIPQELIESSEVKQVYLGERFSLYSSWPFDYLRLRCGTRNETASQNDTKTCDDGDVAAGHQIAAAVSS